MGTEAWLKYKNSQPVKEYLATLGFADNYLELKAPPEEDTNCSLHWERTKLVISSDCTDECMEWAATIAYRLHELFPSDRSGDESQGWWPKSQVWKGSPFKYLILKLERFSPEEKELIQEYANKQERYLVHIKTVLPGL